MSFRGKITFTSLLLLVILFHLFKVDVTFLNRMANYKTIELEAGVFPFALNDDLLENWQTAINKSIPLFLHDFGSHNEFAINLYNKEFITKSQTTNDNFISNFLEYFLNYFQYKKSNKKDNKLCSYYLKLPNFPKNISEMITIRCWLEHLFNCGFEYADFNTIVFNPELINLLFDNDKTIPLQFNIQKLSLDANTNIFENISEFIINHLTISESLKIAFDEYNISKKYIDILFNILINEGNKLFQVCINSFRSYSLSKLYDLLFEYIRTTTNCSKMVPVIMLEYLSASNFVLKERGKNVQIKHFNGVKYTKYQITNKHNPNVKFSFCNAEWKYGVPFQFKIKIMKN
ncbi:unnamed protein product [Meloidogyne enterolobii]|uniref:Uncharacterized protein n=1 Tax=Meloidogyne enterolobii TaxID=390850 RepID=A0ACB0YXN7_MELEN